MEITITNIVVIFICVFFTGLAKGGIVGAGSIAVPLLALLVGGKCSVGILLPISAVSALISAIKFRSDIDWHALGKVLPWAIFGITVGAFMGVAVSDHVFFIMLAIVILIGCLLTTIQHRKHSAFKDKYGIGRAVLGTLAGFSAMIGNATGPLISVLFLLQRFPKKRFVCTYVWFCFITDVIKVPILLFSWESITWGSIIWDVAMIPAMILGVISGFWLIRILPDRIYRNVVLIMSCLAAIMLIFHGQLNFAVC